MSHAISTRLLLSVVFLVFLFPSCLTDMYAQTLIAQVPTANIDASKVVGKLPNFAQYTNTSLRFAPPHELAGRAESEYGKPIITRVWLPLDDMWDYRDGSYHFNFEIGADRYAGDNVKYKYDRGIVLPSNIYFEDYLRDFSTHSQYLLLNIRRYEVEVINGKMSLEKWKEVVKAALLHYKAEFGNIRYIESLNEYHIGEFGGLTDEQYYGFYKATYELVAEVNRELKPAIPLEVGGPCVVGDPLKVDEIGGPPKPWNKTLRLSHFLQQYRADPNPGKKLDFISFHDYDLGHDFLAIAGYQDVVRTMLKRFDLGENLPLFITEIGYAGPKPVAELNQHQATGISDLFFYARREEQLHLFPWVLYHEPARQLSLTAFVLKPDLRLTPFGEALKMWSQQKKSEVEAKWTSPAPGLNLLASRDGEGVVVEMWNNSGERMSPSVSIANLPVGKGKRIRVREYRIDAQHNNVFSKPTDGITLVSSSDTIVFGNQQHWSVILEPYAMIMWTLERAGK